jgi:hypothetical protein
MRWTKNPVTGGEACFSDDAIYRYRLVRPFYVPKMDLFEPKPARDGRRCLFVMLNPSTADAFFEDPTIRRCMSFARSWGFDILEVVNLFALRSTDPHTLYEHADPIGPDNDGQIAEAIARSDLVIAAWGAHGKIRERNKHVLAAICKTHDVHALKVSQKTKAPYHPLYLAADTKPAVFVAKGSAT